MLTPADPQDLNAYAYAGDSPPSSEDPTGMLVSGGGSACSGGCGAVNWGDQPGDDGRPTTGSGKMPPADSHGTGSGETSMRSTVLAAQYVLPKLARSEFVSWLSQPGVLMFGGFAGAMLQLSLLEGFCAHYGNLCGGIAGQLLSDWVGLAAKTSGVMAVGGFGEAGEDALDGDVGTPDHAF